MIKPDHPALTIGMQCRLLSISRSSFYYEPQGETETMQRVRVRIGDIKVTRLLGQFLKAGVLAKGIVLPTDSGTPQGGVISPLLTNIALGVIEERYERWTHHQKKIRAHRRCDPATAAMRTRMTDRKAGRPVFFPIRYADDFIVLVAGAHEQADQEKAALAGYLLETMGLELSIEKTPVSDPTEGFEFLGHRVRYKWHPRFGYMPRIEITAGKRADSRFRSRRDRWRMQDDSCLRRAARTTKCWRPCFRRNPSRG
jgi:hypothetical protein